MGNLYSTSLDTNKHSDSNQQLCNRLQSTPDHFFLNIRAPNLIQVVDAPRSILQYLITCLGVSVNSVQPIWRPNTYEIELNGTPFREEIPVTLDDEKFATLEIAFCRFLSILHSEHWRPYVSLNLSPFCDRSTCYFRKNHVPATLALENETKEQPAFACVTFRDPNSILMAGNRQDQLEIVRDAVKTAVATVIQNLHIDQSDYFLRKYEDFSYILKVPCNLWKCVSLPDSLLNRRILLEIFSQMEKIGYRLSISIDYRGNADSLFFIKTFSSPKQHHIKFTSTYCLLSTHQCNLMRLYNAPKDLIDVTRLLINQHWQSGLSNEQSYSTWHEFHLTAFPWAARTTDAVQSRSMLAYLLQTYLARGWRPVASLLLSRTFKDRTCILLRKNNPAYRPHICLGLLDSNELHLINAENELREYVTDFACSSDALVSKKGSKTISKGGWPVMTFRGAPWCSQSLANYQLTKENGSTGGNVKSYDYLESRALIQQILVALRYQGWEPVCPVDIAARVRCKRKSVNAQSWKMGKINNDCAVSSCMDDSIPLDVNSLILANINGSRHNSFARSAHDSPLAIKKSHVSID